MISLKKIESLLNSFSPVYNPDSTFKQILDIIAKAFDVSSCLIVDTNNSVQVESSNTPSFKYTKSKLDEALKSKKPKLYTRDILLKDKTKSIVDNLILSVMVFPIFDNRERLIGALYMDRRKIDNPFNQEEFEAVNVLFEKIKIKWLEKIEEQMLHLVYRSDSMKKTIESVKENIALSNTPVLILGESGVGKDIIANAIHYYSSRREKKYKKFNSAAINDNLIESVLFGTVEGAFTGALNKEGLFEYANNGTLFLDEIGEMSRETQTKILSAIEDKNICRVGSNKDIPIDVRLIFATNRDLKSMVEDNKFRKDLFYRIKVIEIKIPPLRERKEDIILLAEYFFNKNANEENVNIPLEIFTSAAKEKLINYSWPGNVRELRNLINKTVVLKKHKRAINSIDKNDFEFEETQEISNKIVLYGPIGGKTLKEVIENSKRRLINDYLIIFDGSIEKVAEELNITRQTVWHYIKKVKDIL